MQNSLSLTRVGQYNILLLKFGECWTPLSSIRNEKKLIAVGAAGFGQEIAWLAKCCTLEYEVMGFLDDAVRKLVGK